MRWTPLVLLADSREHDRIPCSSALRQRGFSVLEAVDGEEAIWIAHTFLPDLLCVDLAAPSMDGIALLEQLRATRFMHAIYAIAVTTISYGAVLTHARAAGFDRVIRRPLHPERLASEIADLLGWPGGYRTASGNWCTGSQAS
jgi:CheY-like chemotaxis protein